MMRPTVLATVVTEPTPAPRRSQPSSRHCVCYACSFLCVTEGTENQRGYSSDSRSHSQAPGMEPGCETGMSGSRVSKTNEKMNG